MSEIETYARKLYLSDFLREPLFRSVIDTLPFPPGSSGLDVGCGIGSHTLMLAKAVGDAGHVTGLDLSTELLAHAKQRARKANLSKQISFHEGDMNKLPFDNDTFDWVWSVDCVGYAPGEPIPLLKELARVVNPGGIIAILAWSSQQLLPGYPHLEACLNATSFGIAPFVKGERPELHFLRARGWFQAAGLKEFKAQTFVCDVQAPLSDEICNALISLFEMRWGTPQSELTEEDWAEYQRLCKPGSQDFILNSKDYYGFFTYSLFHGKVAR